MNDSEDLVNNPPLDGALVNLFIIVPANGGLGQRRGRRSAAKNQESSHYFENGEPSVTGLAILHSKRAFFRF